MVKPPKPRLPGQIVEPRVAGGHILVVTHARQKTVAASSTPAEPSDGGNAWIRVLLVLTGLSALLALTPERVVVYGSVGRALVRSRLVFAAAGIVFLIGLAVPMLAGALQ